ncbi:hypothetical protein [Streptomyces sp. MW-W600-10]|uniref:hypothetical protein n=1 Tax=Streptomyces sp. MW-W600-10 TaxID=2829819 RepID=UPI001C486735|nr:hypothetical protein [Streptomyces sp. MW-W600-10]MBV7246898.1 hypothetical protein [Streptomyces sp. MW-W600-10]
MKNRRSPEDEWKRLKPDAEHALQMLLSEIPDHATPQSLFEAYAYAKNIAARAMQSRMLGDLPAENRQFKLLHAKINQEMYSRYKNAVPASFLRTPYSGKTHEYLFSLLQKNLAQPVQAAMLRIVTADNVHTERRARELRELGLDVHWYDIEEISVYELRSLDIDFEMIPAIIRNNVRKSKSMPKDQKQLILRNAGIPEI